MKPKTRNETHAPRPQARIGGVQAVHAHKDTHPNTRASSAGVQPKPKCKHPHQHRTPKPGLARYKRGANTITHIPTAHPISEG